MIYRLVRMPKKDSDILVFKTSLQTAVEVQFIAGILDSIENVIEWSVDLDDWEKVLRIKSDGVTPREIMDKLNKAGIKCKKLMIQE